MKKCLPLLITFFFSTLAMAQYQPEKSNIAWSKALPDKKKTTFNQLIGENEEGIFVTKTTIKDEIRGNQAFPTLEVYDDNLNVVKSRNLEVKEGKGKIIYENMALIEGNLYLFYSLVYVWNQSITLMVQPLDTKTLHAAGEPK